MNNKEYDQYLVFNIVKFFIEGIQKDGFLLFKYDTISETYV
jgi:hypothetical protein